MPKIIFLSRTKLLHSVLRLDATTKKSTIENSSNSKKLA